MRDSNPDSLLPLQPAVFHILIALAQDSLTLALATGLLLFAALSAAYLPARRASRLDPMVALRQE